MTQTPAYAPERDFQGGAFVLSYTEFTTDIAVTNTTAAAADTIVTAPSFTPNGADSYFIEFFAPGANPGSSATAALIFVLYDNGSIITGSGTEGRIIQVNSQAAAALIVPVMAKRRVTPTAVAHVFSVHCYRVTTNGTVLGSNSGTGAPGYIMIIKA